MFLPNPLQNNSGPASPVTEEPDGRPVTPRPANKADVRIADLASLQKIVLFSEKAWDKTNALIAHCSKEVSWFGMVTERDDSFYVEDIILFKQTVSSSQTEIKDEDIQSFFMELVAEHGETEALETYLPKIKLWGHSHVNMTVDPSGTDDKTLKYMFRNDMDFFIRVIGNKRGDMKVDLYRNFHCAELQEPLGFSWLDTSWDIIRPLSIDVAELLADMKEKVFESAPVYHRGLVQQPSDQKKIQENQTEGSKQGPDGTSKTTMRMNGSESGEIDSLSEEFLEPWQQLWWLSTFAYADFFKRFFDGKPIALAGPAYKED